MIKIREVSGKKELKQFVKFPFKLFKGNPFWVPPIIKDELDSFNPNINPAFETATARFFLAYKNKEIVGRVAAIINHTEVQQQGLKKMRFGWFDVIDDIKVTKALLDKVYEIGKANNLEYIEGPLGFSNLDKVGVLTSGFDLLSTMISWYSYPYYHKHLLKLGYTEEKHFIEGEIDMTNVNPDYFIKAQKLIKARYGLKPKNFSSTKEFLPYVDKMFELLNETYAKLSSFVPISKKQQDYFKDKYISLINPEYLKFILDKDDNVIAFSIVMPAFAKALQKANGKLWPFGIFHILKAKKHSKEVLFYLIGIKEEYQNKGVTAIIFDEYFKTFKEKGIKKCFRTPELIENHAIHQIWKHFKSNINKDRKTFSLPIK
ncbi:MAG: GTP cyclohydrolase [Flavobacteriales bacterium]|nr:MAG: GTP cyclohydrolase [Flavobacteriales bacterium]